MDQCLLCDQARGVGPVVTPIYEDDLVYAYHVQESDEPTYLGHLILQTKQHIPGFAELTDDEAERLGLLVTRLSRALKSCTSAEKVYEVFFGETVPHLHIHLTGRYPGTPPEYWRMNVEDWPGGPRGNSEDVARLSERLRTSVARDEGRA